MGKILETKTRRPRSAGGWPILVLLAVLLAAGPAHAVRIKLATKAPENFKSARIVQQMAKEIEEKTDRNVRFKIYYGGVKGTGRDLLLKMKSGEIQGGEFTAGEASSVLNDLQAMNIPLTFKSYEEVDHVLDKMSAYFREELGKRGYVVLGWLEVGFGYIMSMDPIAGKADLQGKKAWIPQGDPIGQAAFEAMGVPPIPMTIADVMVALQTGQINTVTNSFVGAIALQWHTRIKYITDVPLLYVYGLLMITQEAYEKIPAEYRETVDEILARYFSELKMDIRKNNRESRETLKKQGIEFVPVPAAQAQELEAIMDDVKKELAGKEFQGEAMKRMQEALREFRNAQP
jgi:TRAP-type C4-dicarboxylate transport system substrate-binding protein